MYSLMIAPDPIHKSNYSGGGPSEILFPNLAIDAEIVGDGIDYGYFVSYLRECLLRWGGFYGFKDSNYPPMDEINFLTKDLLPF